ncbi:MAG: SDR family NAD(P)-dependent oxidoreductase, partial [Chlorobi bacterium]|nr:SDR family NAD(P)-dependent oxidoreductase [Chlorobiota bacterium]
MTFFKDKNIVITGASTGIGKALVEKLRTSKCNLFIVSRNIDLLNELKNDSKKFPANIFPFRCDVSKKEEVKETFRKISEVAEQIDVAILNAGVGDSMTVEKYDSALAEKIFGVNVLGVIYWIERLLPGMMKRKSGVIAGVSSLADNRGYSQSGFYCASKAALTLYLEGLRGELAGYGINVATIKPGFVKTPMTDKNKFKMPFIISAEKSADYILNGLVKKKKIIQFPLPTVLGHVGNELFHACLLTAGGSNPIPP